MFFEQKFLLIYQMIFYGAFGLFNDCNRSEYDRCVRIADPLVKEAHLVFPDNMRDIEMVCQTWNNFVDCIRKYTDKCFNDQQRRQFNKAVENPIESVHQMCSQPHYQSEYLRYAPCIKSTITDASHCGPQYNLLVEQVEQGATISKTTLCCSHDKFKECVQRETRRLCDGGISDGAAAKFSNQIMEKALSFLQEQCFNYIANTGDCNSITTADNFDPLLDTTLSEIYSSAAGREWSSPSTTADIFLGSRTRPASYGRASSWTDTQNNNHHQSITPSPIPSSSTQAWSFSTSNDGITQPLSESTSQDNTAWYPAAGASSNLNEVDEPHQQGLAKPKNSADTAKQIFSLTVVATVLTKYC